ncbi:MAG TPA: cupin domain-containing protein [Hyphomicrobiaceae bacterium]|nr:cupin domain-containing protein [Hyphomicrobiaceae bacterium]
MARVVRAGEARLLKLPGRISKEIVSGAHGGAEAVTLRLVEIPVPSPGEPERGRHCHDGHEECIYVLSGRGTTWSGESCHPLAAGDAILIPPGEMHVTRNTGSEPLVLICFFPVAAISMRLEGKERS